MKKQLLALVYIGVASLFVSHWAPLPITRGESEVGERTSFSGQSALNSSGEVIAIVELDREPLVAHEAKATPQAEPGRKIAFESQEARDYESLIIQQQEAFKSQAAAASPGLRVRAQLHVLANAVSVEVPPDDIAQIASLPGVKRVEFAKQCRATLDSSVPLIGAPALWERAGGTPIEGQGIRIAIIDTGIDISNPLFSDTGFTAPDGFPRGDRALTNNKVIVAKAFLADSSATPGDEHGHGSHVAGIAAGRKGTVSPLAVLSGVAPAAYLGNYRVLDKSASGRSDLIALALEEALKDGFSVANLSLGTEPGKELNFLDRTVEAAVAAGMVVITSAGNNGQDGQLTIGSPGIAPSAITVGATTNAHFITPVVAITEPALVPSGLSKIEAAIGQGSLAALSTTIGPLPCVDVASLDGQRFACAEIPAGSLSGTIALIERGGCTFKEKVNAADSAGAAAVIVFNKQASDEDGLLTMDVSGTKIPSVFIGRSNGLRLRDLVRQHQGARVRINRAGEIDAPPDVLAPFSSRGPSLPGALKPDLVAPGVDVYSGAIRINSQSAIADETGFLAVSGTSQAAPHVTGAAALLKQLHSSWNPEQIKSALVSAAANTIFTDLEKTLKAGLLDVGAGRVDIAGAGSVNCLFSPTSLSFGINKLKKRDITLTAELRMTGVGDGVDKFSITLEQNNPDSGVTFSASASEVVLARGESASITIVINARHSAPKRDYTGFVAVSSPGGRTLRLPFWARFVKK